MLPAAEEAAAADESGAGAHEQGGEGDRREVDEIALFEGAQLYEKQRRAYEAQVLERAAGLLARIFTDYPTARVAQQLSRGERSLYHFTAPSLAYTELELSSFHGLFTKLHRLGWQDSNEGRFVDIGAGVGKSLFAACLFHEHWKQCVGIEILTSLHQASLRIKDTWNVVKSELSQAQQDIDVQFLLGDALTMGWAEPQPAGGSVVLINSTAFTEPMMAALSREACRLRSGAFVITTSQRLVGVDRFFDLVASDGMRNSAGPITAFIYRRGKIDPPGHIGDADKYVRDLLSAEV